MEQKNQLYFKAGQYFSAVNVHCDTEDITITYE